MTKEMVMEMAESMINNINADNARDAEYKKLAIDNVWTNVRKALKEIEAINPA